MDEEKVEEKVEASAEKPAEKPRKPGRFDRAQPILRNGGYKQVHPRGTVARTEPKVRMSKKERLRLRKTRAA